MKSDYKVYNLLLPIWLLIFFPSWLWLLLIPANYLIDRIVLRWSLGDMPEKGLFCRNHNWKICLAGFASDFAGAILLFALNELMYGLNDDANSFISKAADGLMFNPFSNVLSLIIVIAAIALSAVCIYKLDNRYFTAKATVQCGAGAAGIALENHYKVSKNGLDERWGDAYVTHAVGVGGSISANDPKITDAVARTEGTSDINMYARYPWSFNLEGVGSQGTWKLSTSIKYLKKDSAKKQIQVKHSWKKSHS